MAFSSLQSQGIVGSMPMGIGRLGSADLLTKTRCRWTFEVENLLVGSIPKWYVKTANRPKINLNETEINFLHGQQFIPGRPTYESIAVTYYDVTKADPSLINLWAWIASVADISDPVNFYQSSTKRGYSGTGILCLYDGCGKMIEKWHLYGIFPSAVDFGELDYSSSEEMTIELTLRFDSVEFFPGCESVTQQPVHTGASSQKFEGDVPLITGITGLPLESIPLLNGITNDGDIPLLNGIAIP